MKTPDKRNWQQLNNTDLFSSISSSKNINLDEYGYLKLTPRAVAIKSDTSDANFDQVLASQDYNGVYRLVTADQCFNFDQSSSWSVTEDTDTGNPTGSIYSDGVTWQGRWYVTGSQTLDYKTTTWTSVTLSPTLTASKYHPLCVFETRNQLMIGNGNVVRQINASHVDTVSLTLPSEYLVTRIAFAGDRAAILAKNVQDTSANGRLFIWNGASSGTLQSIDIEAQQGFDVVGYKGTFVVLNSNGQLLKYNGSAVMSQIGQLPIFYSSENIIDNLNNYATMGRIMFVDGDDIYFNLIGAAQVYGRRWQRFIDKMPGGTWCYNPTAGIYHRSSLSQALAFTKTATTGNVNTSTDVITVTATVPRTGTPVKYYSPVLIGGLDLRTTYYVIKLSSTTFKLATTKVNADAGSNIDLTSTGHDTQYFTFYPEDDFGVAYTSYIGHTRKLHESIIGMFGGILSSGWIQDNAGNFRFILSATVPNIENRGYFTTGKFASSGIIDSYSKLYIKHKPLQNDIDKIIIKYKTSDFTPISTPATIKTVTKYATWTNGTTFTIADPDWSSVSVGDEVEILSGNGAGQRAHISTIVESSGTYTVVLDETVIGVSASDISDVSVDRWKKLATITTSSLDNIKGYSSITLPALKSRQIEFKIELRGIDVTIEDLDIINTNYKLPA